MLITSITQRLRDITSIVGTVDTIGAEQAYTIAKFFRDYGDTNAIIDEAVKMAERDIDQLEADAVSLIATIADYEAIDKTKLQQADFKAIVDAHLKTFEAPQKAAQQRANELWQSYQQMSNRLDYLHLDCEEYPQLDAECDAAKAAYKQASDENTLLYNRYRDEQKKYSFIYFFEPEYLDILIVKLRQICESILVDLKNGKEGGL